MNNEQLSELVDKYLKLMDKAPYGEGLFFKEKSQKDDLETKVWHFLHKIEAASYHMNKITKIAENMRLKLKEFMKNDEENPCQSSKRESSLEVENKEILFEVDAFFTASRSSLDFLASILSRYMKGKKTDKIRDCVKFFKKDINMSEIKIMILKMWENWGEDLIEYRDYLVHNGALNPPKAIVTKVFIKQNINGRIFKEMTELEKAMNNHIFNQENEFIVFPLPKKPNKKIRITRMNRWFEREMSEMPEGFSKEEFGASTQIEQEKVETRKVRYILDYRYSEADELCRNYYSNLLCFSSAIFSELQELDIKFIM